MRLQHLRVHNWRSFPAADIDLSEDITVIVGQNGAGKTALLNAFVWGLYGKTTSGFPRPEDLCNHQARAKLDEGGSTQVEVEVTFRHRECTYKAHRSFSVRRTGPNSEDFEKSEPGFVLSIYPDDDYAQTLSDRDADRAVEAILPVGLNPYFFFPAENVGTAAAPDRDAALVKDAVETILGLKRYDIALAAIKSAYKHSKLKAKQSDDFALSKAREAAEKARKRHDEATDRLKVLPQAIRDAKRARDAAQAQFERYDGARELIDKRNDLQRDHDEAQRKANDAVERRHRILDGECFNLFGLKVLDSALSVLDQAKADHKIPPKVSAGLLDELIEDADSCICGTSISDAERQTLSALRSTVVEDTLAEAASNIRARVAEKHGRLRSRPDSEQPHKLLQGAQTAIHDAHARRKTLEDELREFDEQNPIPDWTSPDPSEAWRTCERKYTELQNEQEDLEARREKLLQARREADRKYSRLTRQQDSSDKIAKARGHLQNIENTIEDLHALFSSRAREDTQRLMNSIARDVFFRNYTIRLTEGFDLDVRQDGVDVGASSGESAWVTFAFVGALANLIDQYGDLKNMDEAGESELKHGVGYPLVLDAPFSPFGEEFATQFAERLPTLVPQSVVIIREDQIRHLDPIMTGEASVAAYLLCFHGPRDDVEQKITWGNESWGDRSVRPYVQPAGDPSNVRTEILTLPT